MKPQILSVIISPLNNLNAQNLNYANLNKIMNFGQILLKIVIKSSRNSRTLQCRGYSTLSYLAGPNQPCFIEKAHRRAFREGLLPPPSVSAQCAAAAASQAVAAWPRLYVLTVPVAKRPRPSIVAPTGAARRRAASARPRRGLEGPRNCEK